MVMRHSLSLLLVALCAACVRNPATGKMELDLLSESQEVELGKQAKQEAEQTYGVYKGKPELASYVETVGKQLAAKSDRPNLPYSYEIVDDSSVNAFALPGGPIFITRGILAYLDSEAEMAAVLGHETGHVAARHSANQMSKQQVAQLGLGVGSILSPTVASAAQVASVGLQVLFLKYSRDDETQADELGFRYMTKVGYDPTQMIPLFEMLDRVSKREGVGKTPEWLQTHPDPGNRLAETQKRLKTELKGSTQGMKVEREKYLQMIDGIVYGEDPRQGYFKGDTYMLLGYTKQGGLSQYGNTFMESMGTFSELKDSSAMDVKPAILKVVKIDQPMSVTDFNARYPSTIKLEEVAVLNGVDTNGKIPAGYAKQVVGGTKGVASK